MLKLALAISATAGLLVSAGCMSDPMRTSSIGPSPQDHSGNAPAYPNRPGIRQPGFEK